MSEKEDSIPFPTVATPTVTTKKVDPPGKKKVIKRLVKNAKTGEVIKTEIVRIDSNGETTITSYPAGTPVPNLQPAGKKSSRSTATSSAKKEESTKREQPRSDVGPSVPVNVPGLEDLLEKEKALIKAKLEMHQQSIASNAADATEKKNEENLEAALISIAKRRHKDPKARRRGLAASTMHNRVESDDDDEDKEEYPEDTDYRSMPANMDDEEEVKKRKERHRRRREKKHREKPSAYKEREGNDSGIDGTLDQRPYDPEDEEHELHPLEEAELLAKQLQAAATLKQQKEAELANQPPEVAMDEVPSPSGEKAQMSEISDEDLEDKPKKKKKKHKKQKKKKKKRRRGSDDERSDAFSDRDRRSSTVNEPPYSGEGLKKEDIDQIRKSRSRSKSFSSLSLSSISSAFSDSFNFADLPPVVDGGRGGFRGRGNMQFRGRGPFRGFPMRGGRPPRGGFRGGWAGGFPGPGMFPPEAMMDPMGNPMFMGRGGPGMWPRGPWGPMMGAGRGFNSVDDGGIGIYVEDDSDGKRSRSYSSYSSYSSRSRSRSRRRHRRRRHSSSRSYSSYSRSSRSYSRSYSRSSRSYSRSYSRSSYSSYSRSRSKSRRSYSSSGRSRSPRFRDIYTQGALEEAKQHQQQQQEEEVPWWAEFDKTYEIQKQAEKEAKLKAEASKEQSQVADESNQVEQGTTLQGTSYDMADMTTEDIDVVRTVMSLVDKASHDQDPDVEDVRRCVSQLLNKVCSSPDLQTPESAAQECMNGILDQICPDDPTTLERKQRLDSNILDFPQIVGDEKSKLLRWYTIACHVTKQTRVMRRQALQDQQEDEKDSRSEGEDHKKSDDKRGKRGRRRRRGRRGRHRGRSRSRSRSYSRSSYSSSSSEKQQKLKNLTEEQQKSLQQAQQLLILQQQQLQAAGILPKNLTLPASVFSNLLPTASAVSPAPEPEVLSQRWDKDMDALLKSKSKDDITRKLMQRMKEKKQEGEDASPFGRTKPGDLLNPEKVFTGSGSLKSRKIAISSIDKSKVFDDLSNFKKSEIAAAQASIGELSSKDQERLRAQGQLEKLTAWSDEQKSLKEEVKRKMREEIEKAERAKKELIKEQMLEEEKQREIMRIREEVREQIKKEIRDEIAKQRAQVLEDPELKSQIMELEALRQSKISKSESSTKPFIKPLNESFVMDQEQDKHKEEMDQWIEKHGKKTSEMDVDEMRKMQLLYMQQLHHWSQQQQKAYMQWYWHQQQHFKQHAQREDYYGQRSSQANEPDSMEFSSSRAMPRSSGIMGGNMKDEMESDSKQEFTFTHAPSQSGRRDEMEGTTHAMPPRGLMSAHENQNRPNMPRGPRPNMQNRFPPHDQFNRGNFQNNNEMMPRRGLPRMMNQQQRFSMRQEMQQRMRHPSNQGPRPQFPSSGDFDMRKQDEYQKMNTPVSGMHGQTGMSRFERPSFDARGGPRFDGHTRPNFEGHHLQGQQRPIRPFDSRMRPPFDQQQQQRPPFDQQQQQRPSFDQQQPQRPQFDQKQQQRPPFDQQQQQRLPFDTQQRPPFDPQRQHRPQFDPQQRPPFDQQQQRPRAPFEQHMRPQFDPRMRMQFDPRVSGPPGQPIPPLMQQKPGMDGQQFNQQQPGLPIRHDVPMMGGPPGLQAPPQMKPQVNESAIKSTDNDQPLPPGVEASVSQPIPSLVTAPPGVEELRPPGEETSPIEVPKEPPKVEKEKKKEEPKIEESPPAKSSKKKKKKHRKHKKRRDRSSSSDDDAQQAAIMKQLEALQAAEEGELVEVEEGEVKSDDEKKPSAIAAAAKLLKQLTAKGKKRHKKRKRRRRETSSSEEEKNESQAREPSVPPEMAGLPPPPFFRESVLPDPHQDMPGRHPPPPEISSHIEPIVEHGIRGGPPVDLGRHPSEIPSHIEPIVEHGIRGGPPAKIPADEHHFASEYRSSPFPPNLHQGPERYSHLAHPHGAGEPHLGGGPLAPERSDNFTRYIGPGGDHTLGQNPIPEQKRAPSPLPIMVPDDPREREVWARRMTEKYLNAETQQMLNKPEFQAQHRKVEKIPSLMDKYIPGPEPRRITALSTTMRGARREFSGGRQHPDDDRMIGKRKSERGRGRGRKRRRGMPRNYHDWDQPVDDGLIYYYSDSDNSSGWGSDKNFDDLLAKKKRETMKKTEKDNLAANFTSPPRPIHVTNTRRPSPGARESMWDRPEVIGEPQGIPVIGGAKPQPIPSLANRGGQQSIGRLMTRDDEFKIQPPEFWGVPNEQQAMLRSSQWDPQAAAREPPRGGVSWPRSTLR